MFMPLGFHLFLTQSTTPLAAATTSLAAWVHQIDPYFIKLWDGGPIRWYGMAYLAGFVVAYFLIRRVLTVGHNIALPPARATDLIVTLAMGAVIGGRIGYCVFYDPQLLITFDTNLPFWGLLQINNGGMASHGGVIGTIVAAWWFARRHQVKLWHIFDLAAFAAPLGLCLGRIANFINGELYGRPCDPNFPLAVQFPQELPATPFAQWTPQWLADLQPAAVASGISEQDWWIAIREPALNQGYIHQALYKIMDASANNPAVAEALKPILTPRHPSQLYAAFGEGLLVFIVLLIVWAKPRKPLVISGFMSLTYSLARIVDELFRLPDEQFIAQDGTLPTITRGQLLTFGFILFSLWAFWQAKRTQLPPIGPWTTTTPTPPEEPACSSSEAGDQASEKTKA